MNRIQARWYTRVNKKRVINKIVCHSMQALNKPDTAEGVGRYFAALPASRKASAHVGADQNSLCRYVDDNDIAYAAPGANHDGVHIELSGYAEYDRARWLQPEMMAMLQISVPQIREWSQKYDIPMRFLTAEEMRRNPNAKGITTHHEISKAFGKSTHWDPGPGFPIGALMTVTVSHVPAPIALEVKKKEDDPMAAYLHCECPTGGYWLVKPSDGGVFAFEGAPYIKNGSLPALDIKPAAPIVDMAPYVLDGVVEGYWLLGGDGGVFAFGKAPFIDSYAAHPEMQQGAREFVGIQPYQGGYVLHSVQKNTDPPVPNDYHFPKK